MALVLTTYAAFSEYAGGLDAADESRDTAILSGVEAGVLRYMRPGIVQTTAVEFYDGPGVADLVLRRRPVTDVASVHVDPRGAYGMAPDAFPFETEWAAGEDYASRSLEASESNPGMLMALGMPRDGWFAGRCGPGWPFGRGNIRVEYTAGYAVIPPEIVLAVHQLAALALESMGKAGPISQERIGRYSYSILSGESASASGADITSARSLLAPYSRGGDPW